MFGIYFSSSFATPLAYLFARSHFVINLTAVWQLYLNFHFRREQIRFFSAYDEKKLISHDPFVLILPREHNIRKTVCAARKKREEAQSGEDWYSRRSALSFKRCPVLKRITCKCTMGRSWEIFNFLVSHFFLPTLSRRFLRSVTFCARSYETWEIARKNSPFRYDPTKWICAM